MQLPTRKNLDAFLQGVKDDYSIGRDDWQSALYAAQDAKGEDRDMPRARSLFATHPTVTRVKQASGIGIDPYLQAAQDEAGIGLSNEPYRRTGQMIGTLGADLTQDASRAIWWLINAPQAAADIAQEYLTDKANRNSNAPGLYSKVTIKDDEGNPCLLYTSPSPRD